MSRWRRFSLLRQFMLVSGAILLIGAVAVGWWINNRIEQVVAENAVRLALVFIDSTVTPHLWDLEDQTHLTPIQKAHLDQVLHTGVAPGSYLAVRVWGRDGRPVYGNPEVIPGYANVASRGFQSALRGEVYMQFADQAHGMAPLEQPLDLLETYFPILDRTGQNVLMVAEFYQSMGALRQSILFSQLQGWAFVGVSTFMMYLALYGFAKRGSDTIERQKAELAESRRQMQAAAVRAAEVNEAFMRRLGSELHDGPAQDLGIALMRIEPLRSALGESGYGAGAPAPPPAAADAESIRFDLELIHAALRSSIAEIRQIAGGLRLPDLDGLDVAAAIRKSAADYARKTGRTVEVEGPAVIKGPPALKSAVYRIVQEALNNGYRHGNPVAQAVRFSAGEDRCLLLRVTDDGSGFDPAAVQEHPRRRPLGLSGLQERAEILGGRLAIASAPGQGTTVEAVLPLSPACEERLGEERLGEE